MGTAQPGMTPRHTRGNGENPPQWPPSLDSNTTASRNTTSRRKDGLPETASGPLSTGESESGMFLLRLANLLKQRS